MKYQLLNSKGDIYVPDKQDQIDLSLGNYLNNFPNRNKLKILFMRESEGIYQFGSKRVYVRVDFDKINIRVGGGYLSIDEFLEVYTPQELEKLERKDPLKRFSEKVAIQKSLVRHEVRENSPIRTPEKGKRRPESPQKYSPHKSVSSPNKMSPNKMGSGRRAI